MLPIKSSPESLAADERESLERELTEIQQRVSQEIQGAFQTEEGLGHLSDGFDLYARRGGKALRPAFLIASCRAVGGELKSCLPAAAGVELFHTWTLVHDDIIDKDDLRRGGATTHDWFEEYGREALGLRDEEANHYGRSLAMLVGDLQHGFAVTKLLECVDTGAKRPVVARIVRRLEGEVNPTLIEGEVLDIEYSRRGTEDLGRQGVIEMMERKTAVLYEFSTWAGAELGHNEERPVESLGRFSDLGRHAGIAFQIKDDILGVVGNPEETGKPVGADIREGKKTLLILEAEDRLGGGELEFLQTVISDPSPDDRAVNRAVELIVDSGSLDYAKDIARDHIGNALDICQELEDQYDMNLLEKLTKYALSRNR